MKKLIAIDIDGTLIDDNLRLGALTATILKDLSKKGHIIVLATGRPLRSLMPYYKLLGLNSPAIAYNGALLCNPSDASFKEIHHLFPMDAIKDIAIRGKDIITSFHCEGKSTIYRNRYDRYLDHYFPYEGMEEKEGKINETLKEDCYAVLFRTVHKNDKALEDIVSSYEGISFRHWSSSFYSELHLPNIGKGSALKEIASKLKIEKEDIIAFGDADNDYEMLKEAKYGFAMKGCKSPLLSSSFEETLDTSSKDGVGKTLQNLIEKGIID